MAQVKEKRSYFGYQKHLKKELHLYVTLYYFVTLLFVVLNQLSILFFQF